MQYFPLIHLVQVASGEANCMEVWAHKILLSYRSAEIMQKNYLWPRRIFQPYHHISCSNQNEVTSLRFNICHVCTLQSSMIVSIKMYRKNGKLSSFVNTKLHSFGQGWGGLDGQDGQDGSGWSAWSGCSVWWGQEKGGRGHDISNFQWLLWSNVSTEQWTWLPFRSWRWISQWNISEYICSNHLLIFESICYHLQICI